MFRRVALLWVALMAILLLSGATSPTINLGPRGALSPSQPGPRDLADALNLSLMTGDTLIYMFVVDPDLFAAGGVHDHAEYDSWAALADSIIDLEDATAEFAFANIAEDSSNAPPYRYFGSAPLLDRQISSTGTGYPTRWEIGTTGRRLQLMRVAFDNYITPNSQVVFSRAYLKGGTILKNYYAYTDSIVFALITDEGYSSWYENVGTSSPAYVQDNYARATWDWQVSGNTDFGADPPTYVAWPNAWSDMYDYYEICDYADWNSPWNADGYQEKSIDYNLDLTDCTQAIVNGKTNNGIMMFTVDVGASTVTEFCSLQPSVGSYDKYSGFFVVKFINKPYMSPFPGGKDYAFVFTSDDGVEAANNAWADVFYDHDAAFSIYIKGLIETTTTFGDKIEPWLDLGMEVGPHGYWHDADHGLTVWNMDYVMADTNSAYFDSLMVDASPEWLYQLAYDYDGDRREDLVNFGKTMALPQNNYSPEVQLAVGKIGYDAVRCARIRTPAINGSLGFYTPAPTRPDEADSLMHVALALGAQDPKNFQLNGYSTNPDYIVGAKEDDPSMAEVAANIRRQIHTHKGMNIPAISMFEHDLKTGIPYATGLDADELDAILDEVEATNGAIMTLGEYARWMKTYSTATQTPPAFAQPDTFEFRADQGIWRILDGMDGRFIPGTRGDDVTPPDYPTDVEADGFDGGNGNYYAVITWDYNTEEDLDYYNIYRSDFVDDDFSAIAVAPAPFTYFVNHNLAADSTYYYYVTAVDEGGNESIPSSQVSATPTEGVIDVPVQILAADAVQHVDADGDSLRIEVAITLNKAAHVKMVSWWDGNDAESWHQFIPADTCTTQSAAFSWHYLDIQDDIMFDTAIPSPIAAADSSINLVWTYTDPDSNEIWPDYPSVVQLERNHNYSAYYTEVTHALTGADSDFTHGPDGDAADIEVRRGIENYRIRGMSGDYGDPGNTITDWDHLDSPYFNQAVWVIFQIHADDGTNTAGSNLVFFPYVAEYEPDEDVTAPSSAFVSVAYDTTSDGASNVILEVKAEAKEPANSFWVWKDAHDGDWQPASASWIGHYDAADDTLAAFAQKDTIHTEIATSALDTVHIGYYPKDKSQNVGTLVYCGPFPFTRKSDAALTGYTIISNHANCDSTSCDNWVSDDCFAFSFNGDVKDTLSTDTDWGELDDGIPPMRVYYLRAGLIQSIGPVARDCKLPVISFGASDGFAGALIDSAFLDIWTWDAITNADSLQIWAMTNADFQGWGDDDYDDASFAFKEVSKSTRWTDTDANVDGYYNLGDLCTVGWYCEDGLAGTLTTVAVADYVSDDKSWNRPLPVKELVQAQSDAGTDLHFLFMPKGGEGRWAEWSFSNGEDAEAQFRPRLEVWVSEDN